jgi:hypothetical protein
MKRNGGDIWTDRILTTGVYLILAALASTEDNRSHPNEAAQRDSIFEGHLMLADFKALEIVHKICGGNPPKFLVLVPMNKCRT